MEELILYAPLIRDSERLAIARAYVKDTRYPDKDVLMAILGANEEKENDDETV